MFLLIYVTVSIKAVIL